MRKFLAAAAAVSVVTLVGFAGTASAASATVDLLWPTGTNIDMLNAGDTAVLSVVLTAGEGDSVGGGVTVDYTDAVGALEVIAFASTAFTPPLPFNLGVTTDSGSMVANINAAGGLGANQTLLNGASFVLGTVTFQRTAANAGGNLEIAVGFTATDHILDGAGNVIDDTTTLNSAFVNVPEPGAISLLVMGLGGVLLAGRGRRS
jgi:hypothetical protein